jgi:hypothetical protein
VAFSQIWLQDKVLQHQMFTGSHKRQLTTQGGLESLQLGSKEGKQSLTYYES